MAAPVAVVEQDVAAQVAVAVEVVRVVEPDAVVAHQVAVADRAAVVVADPVAKVARRVAVVMDAVVATVDRSQLRAVQTPQGFAVDVLREAYASAGDSATDDAGLVERIGGKVQTVPGHPHALKITTAFDLAIAEAVLAGAGEDE